MTGPDLGARGALNDALGSALRHGGAALGDVPELLRKVLVEETWRDYIGANRKQMHHEHFADFVVTPPLAGLGADLALIKRILADPRYRKILDLLDQALQNPDGGDLDRRTTVDNIHGGRRPSGTSQMAALRRLRKDRPDLHAKVLADELSAHAAMIVAGYRPRTISVRLDSMTRVADTLRRNLTDDQVNDLLRVLLAMVKST